MHSYTEAGILIFHYLKNVSFTTEPTVLLAYKVVPFFWKKKSEGFQTLTCIFSYKFNHQVLAALNYKL